MNLLLFACSAIPMVIIPAIFNPGCLANPRIWITFLGLTGLWYSFPQNPPVKNMLGLKVNKLEMLLCSALPTLCFKIIISALEIAYYKGRNDPEIPLSLYVGTSLLTFALVLQNWSSYTIGRDFTILITKPTNLVEKGPYGVIRHPLFTGFLSTNLSIDLVLGSWKAFGLTLYMTWILTRRATVEENHMITIFGQKYKDYQKRTWRLIPFLF